MTNAATDSFISQLSKYPSLVRDVKDLEVRYLPTGVIGFDVLSGGGFPKAALTEVAGPNKWGKTLLTLLTASHTIRHGGNCAYLYLEMGNVDHEWATQFRTNLLGPNFAYFTPPDGNEAGEIVMDLIRDSENLGLRMIVIDSLACMMPATEQMKDMSSDDKMSANAKFLSVFTRRLGPHLRAYGREVALIGINQVRQGMGAKFKFYYAPGGEAKDHQASMRVMMDRPEPIKRKGTDRVIGYTHKGHAVKNKTHTSEGEFEFDVYAEPEIFHDPSKALLKYGIQYGIFTNDSGAVYSGSGKCHFEGELLGAKQEDVRQRLYQDDNLSERVYQAIWSKI